MERVVFSITFKSKGGVSIYNNLEELNSKTFVNFIPKPEWIEETKNGFVNLGCLVEAQSEVGLTLSCELRLFEKIFNTKVIKERIKYISDYEKYVYKNKEDIHISPEFKYIEKIIIPKQSFELDTILETERPELEYHHLNVPDDIIKIGKVEKFHKGGIKGNEINVVMIDTGLYSHQHYKKQGINFNKISAVSSFNPEVDERGHGTAMSSVLLSIAPEVNYTMIKSCDAYYSYPIAALQKATELKPDIVNCSWGIIGFEPQIYLEIANAIDRGIIVVFSSGNGSSDRKKAFFQSISYPEAITVGGCYVDENLDMELSDISSGYKSDIFVERYVPDLCGICGKLPKAQLILLPTQPACIFDVANGKRDGTKQDDGWMVSSGTSAAAAYVSGLIALYLQINPKIDRKQIKSILQSKCLPILKGKNYMGYDAVDEMPNSSSGKGFLTSIYFNEN